MNCEQTIFRSKLTKDFTTLPNIFLRDERLSYKARGLAAMVLSNCEEWRVSCGWLEAKGTEGRDAIKGALDELRELGYATFKRELDPETKRFDRCVWNFYDEPGHWLPNSGFPKSGKPKSGKPLLGKPLSGKPLCKEGQGAEKQSAENNQKKAGANAPDAVADEEPEPPQSKKAKGQEEAEALLVYAAYPRKVGRPKAVSAIKTAAKKCGGFDKLKKLTTAFAEVWRDATAEDMAFCPHPATWFNQERYDDDPATWRRKSANGHSAVSEITRGGISKRTGERIFMP